MVNFRYHIVSIVAVFLALAIGIVMGTTVISESVVTRLERDARDFRTRNGELRQEADRLEQELSYYDRFGAAVVPPAITGLLKGRSAVLILTDATPGALIDRVTQALSTAGALKPSRIRITGDWELADQAAREKMAAAAGTEAGEPGRIRTAAGEAIGRRLARPSDPRADDDVLGELERAGLLRLEDVAEGTSFPATGSVFIVLAPGNPDAIPGSDEFFLPALRAAGGTLNLAVVEGLDSPESLAEKVRGDGDLSRSVATVDHATTWPGALSLIVALRDSTEGKPPGHYGVRRGASAVAPATPAPPPAPPE